jgi:hypothetical protein
MAEESGPAKDPIVLRQKIDRSRELVMRDLAGLGYELDFPLKLKRTFQNNKTLWIGSAIALGLLVALLQARTKKVYVSKSGKKTRPSTNTLLESGLLLSVLKLGLNLVQPAVTSYLKGKLVGSPDKPRGPRR